MKNIPNEVIEYVRGVMQDYEYADNMRIMPKDATREESASYEDARDNGCCGFVDYRVFVWGGIEYYYGFNYGH
jgi:hypothetical protein